MSATKRVISAAPPNNTVSAYLFIYNVASSVAWATILSRTIIYAARDGFEGVYPAVGEFVRTTQAFACLELLHAATRLVRAPLFTTFIQLLARLFIVWVVTYAFPHLAKSPAYTVMLLAWSFTEVIRYSYFGAAAGGSPPNVLIWLRYTTFFVLYPVGMATETWLVYSAVGPATAGLLYSIHI
ncbi:related to protein tyrosine phosphatase-like protein (putative anti-phosphatase); pepino protein; pasticcino protein pas2 [Cephalotrichum gorgonifer]|uniref:Very-long-chain (3R)-3-hydroxyacyl-CoA dehydratase n=1 Tax=Cephalotrichum gorgonifer TaxID=2041049 RepID=A0AAE8MWP2_9PEZI|nr:related to protein tyrosine phosphatase-like protein (putative anti-phosphatase); pepino protein; pasticcino protein pas2 [Cephalotrichum gorgonifer]